MIFRKLTLSDWFKDSFHIVFENVEYDETAQIWLNPVNVMEVYTREVGFYETNTI